MRNILFVNLIQRLNTLNKNSNAILKQSNLLRLNTKPLEPCTFTQSKRHSSSNSHGSSDFSRTAIVYTLFGATLSGGLLVSLNKYNIFLKPKKSSIYFILYFLGLLFKSWKKTIYPEKANSN